VVTKLDVSNLSCNGFLLPANHEAFRTDTVSVKAHDTFVFTEELTIRFICCKLSVLPFLTTAIQRLELGGFH
jgi:hypothetical protein